MIKGKKQKDVEMKRQRNEDEECVIAEERRGRVNSERWGTMRSRMIHAVGRLKGWGGVKIRATRMRNARNDRS